jgi:hypothetical protein
MRGRKWKVTGESGSNDRMVKGGNCLCMCVKRKSIEIQKITTQRTPHTAQHSTAHTVHTVHTAHSTAHTAHTVHTVHTAHTAHSTAQHSTACACVCVPGLASLQASHHPSIPVTLFSTTRRSPTPIDSSPHIISPTALCALCALCSLCAACATRCALCVIPSSCAL